MKHDNSVDCHQCGMCCKAICMGLNRKQLEDMDGKPGDDGYFVLNNWVSITRREAYMINPHLEAMDKKYPNHKQYFYKCTKLTKDNKCSIHDHRPHVCSSYPWYNKERDFLVDAELIGGEQCGFYKHVIKEIDYNDDKNK